MATNESKNAEATRRSAEVKEWELDYSLKKQPVIAVGKEGSANNEIDSPSGLAIYEPNQLIYIADGDNCRIQVITFEGNFVTNFGQDILEYPWGITVTEDHVFVTDNRLHALFNFNDLKLFRTGTRGSGEGELYCPMGLCTDYNGDVYVADCNNNRVCIYSEDLKFLNCLGTQQLEYPTDVKVTPNSIVVLDISPNCVHFFLRSGQLINSCVSRGPLYTSSMVYIPSFFCLDPAGNILISDYSLHAIKILSPSGELIHTIGSEENGSEKGLCLPCGICISQLGTIFVSIQFGAIYVY